MAKHDMAPAGERRRAKRCINIADLRLAAARRLPRGVFDFIDGGAGDETTLRDNVTAFERWRLVPRVARNVANRVAETEILGRMAALPLAIAPVGLSGFFHPGGEIALARAAAGRGIPFCLSTNSVASIEEVAKAVTDYPGDRWFQIYFLKDRDWMHELLRRAADSDFRALCITVDLPLTGRRERDSRNAFAMPLRPTARSFVDLARRPGWLLGVARSGPMRLGNFVSHGRSGFIDVAKHVASLFDPSADWDDVARLRDMWKGPVLVKGVLHPDDALRAQAIGVDAIVVSNHGGRQLDHAPAAAAMLPEIAAAVGTGTQVFVDGGIRRGTDILKARALGATACLIGRPAAWGLASAGQPGVERAIDIFADEIDNAMTLLGIRDMPSMDKTFLRHQEV